MTMTRALDQLTPPVPGSALPAASRRCLIAGGSLFALGNVFHPLTHSTEAYRYPTWELAHLVMVASAPFLILGLPFLVWALQAHGRERAGKAAAILLLVGWLGIGPSSVIEAFIAPEIGHAAMNRLAAGGLGKMVGLFGTAFLAGVVVLGWQVHRTKLGVPGVGLALIGSGVALVVPVVLGLTETAAFGAVIIGSTVVYGLGIAALGLTAPQRSPSR